MQSKEQLERDNFFLTHKVTELETEVEQLKMQRDVMTRQINDFAEFRADLTQTFEKCQKNNNEKLANLLELLAVQSEQISQFKSRILEAQRNSKQYESELRAKNDKICELLDELSQKQVFINEYMKKQISK